MPPKRGPPVAKNSTTGRPIWNLDGRAAKKAKAAIAQRNYDPVKVTQAAIDNFKRSIRRRDRRNWEQVEVVQAYRTKYPKHIRRNKVEIKPDPLETRHLEYIDKVTLKQDLWESVHKKGLGTSYKLSVGFAVLLQNTETGEYKVHHPQSNTNLDMMPKFINSDNDFNELFESLTSHLDSWYLQPNDEHTYENSKWKFVDLLDIVPHRTDMGQPIGAPIQLPDYILKSKSVAALDNIENNLCVFACIAAALEKPKNDDYRCFKNKAKGLFKQFYNVKKIPRDYPGLEFDKLHLLEDFFNLRIAVFNLQPGGEAIALRKSERSDGK
ncbi:hypothetical protein HK097_009140 [Rhizophlyctis rosea]|uniref:Uncharacterized protein n=1 Tax=Rhizophlyctis rosea TaxID=64517 RepID=A0AAD5X0N1_9FUNG|nr:hypothetical protein HK097_009140 [Rhizophlyctis rosea]